MMYFLEISPGTAKFGKHQSSSSFCPGEENEAWSGELPYPNNQQVSTHMPQANPLLLPAHKNLIITYDWKYYACGMCSKK